jgi:hypothetical protein
MIAFPSLRIPYFGNLTKWDWTNADHRPVICYRGERMHWRPAESGNEAKRRRPTRPSRSRCVRRYVMAGQPNKGTGEAWRGSPHAMQLG